MGIASPGSACACLLVENPIMCVCVCVSVHVQSVVVSLNTSATTIKGDLTMLTANLTYLTGAITAASTSSVSTRVRAARSWVSSPPGAFLARSAQDAQLRPGIIKQLGGCVFAVCRVFSQTLVTNYQTQVHGVLTAASALQTGFTLIDVRAGCVG